MTVSGFLKAALPLVAALQLISAQSTSSVNGATAAITTGASTTQSGEITIHTITVGKKKDTFIPNSIQANPGDVVTFQFWPSNHSVIRSEYGYPCIPYEDIESSNSAGAFYSGFQPVANETSLTTWNLTINDTSPVWFYCGAPGSCIGWGMLGAINVVNQSEIATQIALARNANYMIEPGEPLPAEVSASMASMASTATQTVTVSATPSSSSSSSSTSASSSPTIAADQHDHHSSGLSTGAIAGIAVGGALVLVLAAALFFLLGRTKTLTDALRGRHNNNNDDNNNNNGNNNGNKPPPPPNGQPQMTYPSNHNSMLPPYAQHVHDYKPAGSVVAEEAQVHDLGSMRSFSPPLHSAYSSYQQYPPQSPPLPGQQYARYSNTSELGGSLPLHQQPQQQQRYTYELAAPHALSPQEAEMVERGTRED